MLQSLTLLVKGSGFGVQGSWSGSGFRFVVGSKFAVRGWFRQAPNPEADTDPGT
jgi:hypothetical protein